MRSVALVISDLGPGGAQRVVSTLASAWAARGHRVAVITLADPQSDFFPLPKAVQRITVGGTGRRSGPLGGLAGNVRRVVALRRAAQRLRPEVLVAFVAPTNVLVTLAAAGTGIRTVISERNDPAGQSFGPVWDTLRRAVYRFADRITANSRGALENLSAFVPSRKLAFVPNPVRVPAGESTERKPVVLAVGRLHRQKAYDVLLRAFAAAELPQWRLEIVGEGDMRDELVTLANKIGVAGRVDWLGRVVDPFPLYRSAAIFALASRHEGTPNALLEAMGCGCACVVSNASPGPLEHVRNGENGLVVPVEDVTALAAALSRLAAEPELAARLGNAAQAKMARSTLDGALEEWEAVVWPNAVR